MREFILVPDPERAGKNVSDLLEACPDRHDIVERHRDSITALFSHSQFLANYATQYPDQLFRAVENLKPPDRDALVSELRAILSGCASTEEGMSAIRRFRKDKQLAITLRDILRKGELSEIMIEMTQLADIIIGESLAFVEAALTQRYGAPEGNAFAVIAMGKLGAEELNFSSDVDPVFVYREEGETSGVTSSAGVTMNRISAFEYYCKLVEELTKFISANTGDGFAYRVDLRLRPQGQRGSLALSLRGYEDYYESWGQLWERAALLRARPIAGDAGLGREFLDTVRPFIYRKYLDQDSIDEIRRMKAQVEQLKPGTFSKDIKRGFGGIREIEFFIQVFQLIYGGREPLLRERGTLKALHRLVQKGLIGYDDQRHLADNYLFLRTLEHRIQQMNDLQTHSLPSGDRELQVLARKMGFAVKEEFLADLQLRRMKVRSIYDSLFQERKATAQPTDEGILGPVYWDMETPIRQPLAMELQRRGVADPDNAINNLIQIRNVIYTFQTIRGRRLLEEVVPAFVEKAVSSPNPDVTLIQLVGFSKLLAASEAYLDALTRRPELIEMLTFVFSQSDYLSKILMSNLEYIEFLVESEGRKKTVAALRQELSLLIERKGVASAVRLLRRREEIRLGIRFLDGSIGVTDLTRGISRTAEAILSTLQPQQAPGVMVVAFGKLGGREIIFNSDLDLIFVVPRDTATADIRNAQAFLNTLMSYTKEGVAYSVDTRLRPDGSKGPLVAALPALETYYMKNAHSWELQALLKARPIAGDRAAFAAFMAMKSRVLTARGEAVTMAEIRQMRERIQRELSKESIKEGAYDIKLGPGGIEEMEFGVQYLQLRNCGRVPALIVPATLSALHFLGRHGIITTREAAVLQETYRIFRTMETVLRLRNESLLKKGSATVKSAAALLRIEEDRLIPTLQKRRKAVLDFIARIEK